ncbi:DNA polymerase IV [Mariprofundus ferrooxydans]|uniref:DNA polymerase Y family protein n=1 Tax=Mariprofundus ferrooxydans TaxID=314344 RepID=UPI00035C7135|nr:DNA polymerase IV [Mariprofundus ferrooxydans]
MTVADWPSAIAHVDCDAFYASCEAARHPKLRGRPICVLSNHNAMVIAKSYDARVLGIRTGTPVWEARRLAPHAAFLTPDFRYYGQISQQMFSILRRYSPVVEVYSIDEGFIDFNGIRQLWKKTYRELADEIRHAVWHELGITVSVGVSVSRTLAKMASEHHKPNGTTVVPVQAIDTFLAELGVGEIPGIGRSRAALLCRKDIRTALQFARADEGLLQRLIGRHGQMLRHELNGRAILTLECEPPLPKSMAKTASMGRISEKRRVIAAYLGYHALRLVADLVAKQLLVSRLYLFLTLESFECRGLEVGLGLPTNSLKRINGAAHHALGRLFIEGESYRGCGVVATQLQREAHAQPDLFGLMREDLRQQQLMQAVNAINRRFGEQAISTAQVRTVKGCSVGPRFRYPLLLAS